MTTKQIRDAFRQCARNFCWGTCVDCPLTQEGEAFPEFCINKRRYDHFLQPESLVEQLRILQKENAKSLNL